MIPKQGTVVSVGPEVGLKSLQARETAASVMRNALGEINAGDVERRCAPLSIVKTGDRVLFNAFAGSDVEVGDERFTIMLEDDILAILVIEPAQDEFSKAAAEVGTKKKK